VRIWEVPAHFPVFADGQQYQQMESSSGRASKQFLCALRFITGDHFSWLFNCNELDYTGSYIETIPQQAVAQELKPNGDSPPPEAEFEFSDVTALMCLLCARQFKSLDQLKRHNKESDLHKARNSTAVLCLILRGLTFSFVLFLPGMAPLCMDLCI
jgi:hypothetical protein